MKQSRSFPPSDSALWWRWWCRARSTVICFRSRKLMTRMASRISGRAGQNARARERRAPGSRPARQASVSACAARLPRLPTREDLFIEREWSVGQVVGRIEIGVHDGKIHRVVRHQTEHLARRALKQLKMGLGVLLRKGGQDARQGVLARQLLMATRASGGGWRSMREILQKLLIELRAVRR